MAHRKVAAVGLMFDRGIGQASVEDRRPVNLPHAASGRGQSLAEFAIVFPVMFLIVAAIIQFGLIFWAQNTLTQIARDTGRWAATQQDCAPLSATPGVVTTANQI